MPRVPLLENREVKKHLDIMLNTLDTERKFWELNKGLSSPQSQRQMGFFPQVINKWRSDPVGFIRDILGVELWSKQREIAESVRDNPRTAVRSCSAGGKTAVSALIVLWFLCAFRPSTVLSTARSNRQVTEQLWREIRVRYAQARIPLGGDLTQKELNMEADWFAIGFSTDEPERITGFHNKHVLVVMDEAGGIGDEVYGAIDNPLAAGFTRLLLLGNPTNNIGKFHDAFASPEYQSFHISAFDTPTFTGEGEFPFLISKQYVEQKKREWGEDSPLYEVYILGNFPSGEGDRLIPFSLAEAATVDKKIQPEATDMVAMGVDTARFGEDENVLYVRKGTKIIDFLIWRKSDTEGCIGHIHTKIKEHNPSIVSIDEGYNPGIVDGLRAMGLTINGVNFGGKAMDSQTFANCRAEMWWTLAQRFKREEIQIPDDKLLLKQLTDIKLKDPNKLAQMLIESKEEMKRRGVKSPDRGDALALCFYDAQGVAPGIIWL